ncbi:DUF1214 domain-containing protein [Halomonas denitrificans]|uniref:DUF1214 domain-containing protein n=1 Tax=Halomonas denitrificans TaxID=370769 RepID=UPI000D346B46|nr:DUF1214 domain-containing protein [Halomonas denitrificans]
MKHLHRMCIALAMALVISSQAFAAKQVTVDNYIRAETDATLGRYVNQGALGKFLHIRQPTPIDKQDVIRMNRDTIYSAGVFDLNTPVTITKPDSDDRFQSMQIINQDHSTLAVNYHPGDYTLTESNIGTRYVLVLFRTFVDASSNEDIQEANALQDQITVQQADSGSFDVPEWDEESLSRIRDAVNVLAATRPSAKGMFGDASKLNPISHLLGTAYGWGGNPDYAAIYVNVVPELNDGETPYTLTVTEKVPVDGFVSVTVYGEDGFMQENDLDAYSVNNVTAEKNDDGSVTVHFGGDPEASNYLPITPGWNYIVRMYQPQSKIVEGLWTFPQPQPVE